MHATCSKHACVRARAFVVCVTLCVFLNAGRVPKKSLERNITTFLFLTATCCTAVFSYLSGSDAADGSSTLTALTAVVSGLMSAISAWNAQQSPDRKLNRYTTALIAIKDLIRWWESLTDVQQASLVNVNSLVRHHIIIVTPCNYLQTYKSSVNLCALTLLTCVRHLNHNIRACGFLFHVLFKAPRVVEGGKRRINQDGRGQRLGRRRASSPRSSVSG